MGIEVEEFTGSANDELLEQRWWSMKRGGQKEVERLLGREVGPERGVSEERAEVGVE